MKNFRGGVFTRSLAALSLVAGVGLAAVGTASAATHHTATSHAARALRFAGEVTAYTAASGTTDGSITLSDRAGASLTYSTTAATTITQVGGTGATISIGDHATVVAAGGAMTIAVAISFSAAAPVSFVGRVTAYSAVSGTTNGSITVRRRDGASLTFSITPSTAITEVGGSGDTLAVNDQVTVVSAPAAPSVAASITFTAAPPVKFTGKVVAYVAASGSTNGSITITDVKSASLTYAVTSTTSITETNGTGATLAVGDHATVEAAASAKTVATSITFSLPPAVTFSGYVTAYSAATSSTPGSITLEKSNDDSETFATTSSTTITERGGSGDALTVGDRATVVTTSATPMTASSISFSPEPPTVEFSGWVTAYTAASGTANGSITLRKRSGASLTYSTTLSTTITEVGGTGDTLAVGDRATVRAETSAKTVATSIQFRPAPPVHFSGEVSAYTAPSGSVNGSLTVTDRAGASLTFSVTPSTVIIELGGSGGTLAVGDAVSVEAAVSAKTVATTILFRAAPLVQFSGKVTLYTPATSSTAGSITLSDGAGATLTYSTTTATVIIQVGGSGSSLGVGDHATVEALASSPTVAGWIAFSS